MNVGPIPKRKVQSHGLDPQERIVGRVLCVSSTFHGGWKPVTTTYSHASSRSRWAGEETPANMISAVSVTFRTFFLLRHNKAGPTPQSGLASSGRRAGGWRAIMTNE